MGIFTYHPGRSKIYRYNTRESRPPWTGLCNKATHATAIGVETEFYNVFINIRPPSGSILLDDKYGLGDKEVPAFAGSDSYRMTISGGGVREDSGIRRNRPK